MVMAYECMEGEGECTRTSILKLKKVLVRVERGRVAVYFVFSTFLLFQIL